jgi:hypothetical protein
MSNDSSVHYLTATGFIETGCICDVVAPEGMVVVMVPAPVMGAVVAMEWVLPVIVEPLFIVVADMEAGLDCPPFVLPPMANAWVARASAAIKATVVNFIC